MSNITDVKQRQAAALKKYGEQPEGTSALWAKMEYVNDLAEILEFMNSDRYIEGSHTVPRFGVLSLISRQTPMYVYGHPALSKLCKTAFTDGVHVFIHQDFYAKLLADVRESNGAEYGIEPLILHELMHKMLNHVGRLRQFPKDLANRAADLSINAKLRSGFPEMEWCKSLRETGLGFKPGDIEKYVPMSEESIARELMNDEIKKKQQQEQGQGQSQGQGQGQSQSGQGQKGQGKGKGKPQQGGDGQSGDQSDEASDGDFGGEGDDHMIDLKDVIDALEEAGLDEARDLMQLPSGDDVEEIARIEQESEDRQHEAIQQAVAQAAQSNGKYPGQHIVDSAAEYMRGFGKGKLHWKLAARELVLGAGLKYKSSYEIHSNLAHVEEVTEALGMPLYLPVELAHKSEEAVLVLIDTSSSVQSQDIRAFLTEIFELKTASENMGDNASEVFVVSADTVMRGEIVEITDDNVDEMMDQGMKVFGRGGTNLGHSLKTAMQLPVMKEKNIRSVIYCTDLFDTPPRYKDLGIPDGVNVLYIAAPSTHSSHIEEFAKAVESYARVVPIREGLEVDLEDTKSMNVSQRGM